jgi:hypothetical protein
MRRGFLGRLLGWPALMASGAAASGAPKGKILIKSAWGSADPT